MAGATLLTLLDDIASILDDVSTMSQVAINKTAGVLGDDLALNAKQVTGLSADRELPVVWKVAVGSAVNKAILIPAALAISALAPWAIKPLLMLGGIYLCYEGVEKILHTWLHPKTDKEISVSLRTSPSDPGPRRRSGQTREIKNPRCDPHRFHPLGRNHRHHPRNPCRSTLLGHPGGSAGRRSPDDRRRLRTGRRDRQAR